MLDEAIFARAGPPPEGAEGDFQFSALKRKWQEEEGRFLSGKLRSAQDLCVQQEMELECLRQQAAALARMLAQVHSCLAHSFD